MSTSGAAAWWIVQMVYDLWMDEWEKVDEVPTPEEAMGVVDELRGRDRKFRRWAVNCSWGRSRGERSKYPQKLGAAREKVRLWLSHPEEWSPYIDQVAVRRADETLHRGDYERLTLRERQEIDRIWARREDPFDWAGASSATVPGSLGDYIPKLPQRNFSQRGENFRKTWTPEQRTSVINSTSRLRGRSRRQKAAA